MGPGRQAEQGQVAGLPEAGEEGRAALPRQAAPGRQVGVELHALVDAHDEARAGLHVHVRVVQLAHGGRQADGRGQGGVAVQEERLGGEEGMELMDRG